MKVIKYVIFSSSEKFEEWQKKNRQMTITQIMPIAETLEGHEGASCAVEVTANFGVMVIYCEEEKGE